jgi:hypothetical protein
MSEGWFLGLYLENPGLGWLVPQKPVLIIHINTSPRGA